MPVITDLTIQKNKKQVKIRLNNGFVFNLKLSQAAKAELAPNRQINKKQISDLIFIDQVEFGYQLAVNFLSFRPRSRKEIEKYLQKKFPYSEQKKIREKITDKLEKQGFINDDEFSLWWLEQRLKFRPKGKRVLVLELKQKGIDREIINRRMDQISRQSQLQAARKILNAKKKLYWNLPFLKRKRRLYNLLARRGFDYSIIQKVIDENS